MTITKADLVAMIAERTKLGHAQAAACLDTLLAGITTALQQGEKVELRGFGSFRTRERAPQTGRNPRTGEQVHVPAKRVAFFKPGRQLRERMNTEE